MTYYIINKETNVCEIKREADEVGTYMLGRRMDNYVIIKSADKILEDPAADVFALIKQLEAL